MKAVSRSNGPRVRGFTLVELLVVVALAAIVIALVGPSMRDLLTRQRLRGINAELVSDIQFARAEAVRRSYPVHVRFGSTSAMTCYVVYIPGLSMGAVPNGCDCTRQPTQACGGTYQEIKTVQVPRALKVTLAASSAADNFKFDWRTGQSDPGDFSIDTAGLTGGALRTSINPAGRPAVCSPDGSIPQVQRCAE